MIKKIQSAWKKFTSKLSGTPAIDADAVRRVQVNLMNMQAFNDYVYNSGNAYIDNCFALLSKPNNQDPGLSVGMKVLEGSMGSIFSEFGPVGAFSSCFLCCIISSWSANTPPSLSNTFANMLIRVDKTHVQLDQDIAVYIQDPARYWNNTFTWNNLTITLGDLATIDFPSEADPEFLELVTVALKGFDQAVWAQTLNIQCKASYLEPTNASGCMQISGNTNIDDWYIKFLAENPAYYCTWTWHEDRGLFDKNYWYVREWCLNFKEGNGVHRECIPLAACNYLFIDSADNVIINPSGLFSRSFVFNVMDLDKVVEPTS